MSQNPKDYAEFEIWQDGMWTAGTFGKRSDAELDARHYAMMSGLYGPVTVYEVINGKLVEVTF